MEPDRPSRRVSFVVKVALATWVAATAPLSGQEQERVAEFLEFTLARGGRGMVLPEKLSRRIEEANRSVVFGPALRRGFASEFGMLVQDDRLVGLVAREEDGVRHISFGCATCHAGKAAGRFIPGLGNKNFDLGAGGRMLGAYLQFENADDTLSRASGEFADLIGNPDYANRTQGIVNAAHVWLHIYPPMKDLPALPAFVKVPAVWGFAAKAEAGYFADGLGRGLGWFGAASWAAGQPAENLTGEIDELRRIESLFESFEAPVYPFAVAAGLAAEGAPIFQKYCMECHGKHRRDKAGRPIHQAARWISHDRVGTDASRLTFPEGFLESLDQTPLGDLLQRIDRDPGFLAPRLTGIWARFPYLHNGSIPNMSALLTPPEDRPKQFSVADAGELHRFDKEKLGLTDMEVATDENGSRTVYRTSDPGHSNIGHDFGTDLSAREKSALIEYLKTL